MPEITFHQELPNDLTHSKYFDPNVPSLIAFDDLMTTVTNDDMASDLFTEGVHHDNISIVFIIQNLFFQGKQSRSISVNADYFILWRNPWDRQQVEAFGQQVYPRSPKKVSYLF